MAEEKGVELKLNPQGVTAPILRTLQDTVEVMSLCVGAVRDWDPSKPIKRPEPAVGEQVPLTLNFNSKRTPEEKKTAYLNWLLAKGFQELARGVRGALEEASVFIAAIEFARSHDSMTWGEFW